MTESQRKIIIYIVIATGFSFLQVLGLTATLGEPASVLCAEGAECPTPPASIETAYGSFTAWEMSEDEFNRYRIEFIVFTFVAQIIPILMLLKVLREQEAQKKRGDSSVGMGTPSE